MKKILVLLVALGCLLTPCAAVWAEESVVPETGTEQTETGGETPAKTELALWWENSVEPYLWQYATALAGAASGVAILVGYIRKIVKALKGSKEGYDADLGKAEAELEAAMQEFKRQNTEILVQLTNLRDEIDGKVSECVTAVKAEVSGVREEAHKSVEMALVAFGNDPKLVSNGYARRIEQIAKGRSMEVEHEDEG